MELKKGEIRHYGPTLFQIIDLSPEKYAEIKIIELDPKAGESEVRTVKGEIQNWMNWRPFKDSVEVDEDVMQGLIMGVFGELD